MQFEISRDGALKKLDNFINTELPNYNFKRNFDLGPDDKSNVSCLSPYISHRLITEYEVAKIVLAKFPYQKVEKYIQEIFWRVYWRGWLEQRPTVWEAFRNYPKPTSDDLNYLSAVNASTGIDCFDHWVHELKTHNYLHNHARMWFASIWVFTLELPWQWGARFFLEHLLDGDSASNTLSWRWVAGIQTKGKTYLARQENIYKYTAGRFSPDGLAVHALPIEDDQFHPLCPILANQTTERISKVLIVCDSDLSIKDRHHLFEGYSKIIVLLLQNESREIKLHENLNRFKETALLDFQ